MKNKQKRIIDAIVLMLMFAPALYMAFSINWMFGVVVLGFVIVLTAIE